VCLQACRSATFAAGKAILSELVHFVRLSRMKHVTLIPTVMFLVTQIHRSQRLCSLQSYCCTSACQYAACSTNHVHLAGRTIPAPHFTSSGDGTCADNSAQTLKGHQYNFAISILSSYAAYAFCFSIRQSGCSHFL
jgi:hypothetical protein